MLRRFDPALEVRHICVPRNRLARWTKIPPRALPFEAGDVLRRSRAVERSQALRLLRDAANQGVVDAGDFTEANIKTFHFCEYAQKFGLTSKVLPSFNVTGAEGPSLMLYVRFKTPS